MSAEEVLTDAFLDSAVECDWTPEGHARHVLDALKAARYAVVKLPKPDHRVEATDDENGRTDYALGDVSVFDDGEVHLFGAAWNAPAAMALGAALITAATAAEAAS